MLNWFKKTDTLDLVVEISYYDSMNCLVLIDTPEIPVTFTKGCDVRETINSTIITFAKNDNKIQSAFKDIRVPSFVRSGWLDNYRQIHDGNFEKVKMLLETQRRFRMEVVDDKDDVVVTDSWMMAMTWFSLGVHRHFKDEPYHIDECCLLVSNGGRQAFVDDDTLQKPIDNFLGRVMPKYDDPVIYDLIKQLVFVWHNQIHNYLCLKTEDAAVSARSTETYVREVHHRCCPWRGYVHSAYLLLPVLG
ncbi:hypothetical protein AP1_0437 [Aeromonas phage AP1]|nr:hypothetical protein AP1_0437 [Aeromonas phage AP1]